MIALFEIAQSLLPPLPPEAPALPATPGVRPNAASLPPLDPAQPVSAWALSHFNFSADPIQARILDTDTHRLILCCTRQWGKSSVAALKALHLACRRPGSFILFTSASLHQSAELLRKFRQLAEKLTGSRCKGDGIHAGSTVLPNGSRIVALPQSPQTVRGYSAVDLIVVDEAAFVSDEMHDALTPMLAATNGQLWFLSSANGPTGQFYKIWSEPSPLWHKFRVTAAECPRISPDFLASERAAKGEAIFLREYMCNFASNVAHGIDPHLVDRAFSGDFPAIRFND